MTTTAVGVAGEESDAQLTLGPQGTALVADGIEGTAVRFGGFWDTHFGKGGQLAVVPGSSFNGWLKSFASGSITIDGARWRCGSRGHPSRRSTRATPWRSGKASAKAVGSPDW